MKKDRLSKIHALKTLPEYFLPVCAGLKGFEAHIDDRDIQVGDYVRIM